MIEVVMQLRLNLGAMCCREFALVAAQTSWLLPEMSLAKTFRPVRFILHPLTWPAPTGQAYFSTLYNTSYQGVVRMHIKYETRRVGKIWNFSLEE